MRLSFGTLRRRRGETASPANVVIDLQSALDPPYEVRCMYPGCSQLCSWPKDAGRPPRFHARGCRERYELERGRLVEEITAIDEALAGPPLPRSDRPYLRSQLARRHWLLEHYPWIPGRGT